MPAERRRRRPACGKPRRLLIRVWSGAWSNGSSPHALAVLLASGASAYETYSTRAGALAVWESLMESVMCAEEGW